MHRWPANRRLFQLRVLDRVGDFLRNWMRERSGRPRSLRVEIRTHGVLTFQNLLARAIGEPVADVARLAARSEPGDQALGGVARTPTGNFRSQRISRAWSRR